MRLAEPSDLPRIVQLTSDGIHPDTVEEIWTLAATTPTPFMVVSVDDLIVSTMAVFEGTIDIGSRGVGYCQAEFVATDPEFRNRGYVGALMKVLHRAALSSGIPVSLVWGLEYFYRQFGYSYAVLEHWRHTLIDPPRHADDSWVCRQATIGDILAMDALQASVQRHVDVAISSTRDRWRWLMSLGHYRLIVAEKDGRLDAMARVYDDEQGIELTETAAGSVSAADAVLAHLQSDGVTRRITVPDRPGGGSRFLDHRSELRVERDAFYLRPTSPQMLIDAMVPVLNDRLAGSSYRTWSGPVPISMYRSGLELVIVDGVVTDVSPFVPDSAPPRGDEAAIPPDLLADLTMGGLGAAGLEERHPDVVLGTQRRIMSTLFPPVTADFLLF